MLQFDAAPVVTSIPFFVNGEEFFSRNRESSAWTQCSAICAQGAGRHRPCWLAGWVWGLEGLKAPRVALRGWHSCRALGTLKTRDGKALT